MCGSERCKNPQRVEQFVVASAGAAAPAVDWSRLWSADRGHHLMIWLRLSTWEELSWKGNKVGLRQTLEGRTPGKPHGECSPPGAVQNPWLRSDGQGPEAATHVTVPGWKFGYSMWGETAGGLIIADNADDTSLSSKCFEGENPGALWARNKAHQASRGVNRQEGDQTLKTEQKRVWKPAGPVDSRS